MAYVTYSDLQIPDYILVELTDDEGSATTDPSDLAQSISDNADIETRIDAAITEADSLINAFIRKKYSVPLQSPPDVIKSVSRKIARYNLYTRRPGIGMPENIRQEYEDSKEYLKMMANGKIDLDIDPTPTESQAVVAESDYEDQNFTADTLKYF